jgi:hypothetical protein
VQAQAQPQPFVVTVVQTPAHETTFEDVVLGSVGMTGVLLLVAIVLGGVLALLLLAWNRRHPPEDRHLPPVSPLVAGPGPRPTSQSR